MYSLRSTLRDSIEKKYERMTSLDQKSFDEVKQQEINQLVQDLETKYPKEFEALVIDFLKHIQIYHTYNFSPSNATLHQDEFYRISQELQQKQWKGYDKQ
jgi:hypothetical protein